MAGSLCYGCGPNPIQQPNALGPYPKLINLKFSRFQLFFWLTLRQWYRLLYGTDLPVGLHFLLSCLDRYVNYMDTEKLPDGFTKGTRVHSFGNRESFRESNLEYHIPLVARRIKSEFPIYTDGTKNYKWRDGKY